MGAACQPWFVIAGRREAASPESTTIAQAMMHRLSSMEVGGLWIPGSALRAAPE